MWIKICGMTTADGVNAALAARVDAIGFVFAESVRQVTPARAAQLAAVARGQLRCIAVTRHPTQSALDEILGVFRPDCLQTDAEDLGALNFPRELEVLPVLRGGAVRPRSLPARVLFEGPVSGSGKPGDWQTASELARRTELVLAGGLNAGNVGQAIASVRPFGVDVSSGVEERPGVKSAAKVAAFVAAVRAEEHPS
jgi:phosphoribosylanthranilate isomerase